MEKKVREGVGGGRTRRRKGIQPAYKTKQTNRKTSPQRDDKKKKNRMQEEHQPEKEKVENAANKKAQSSLSFLFVLCP
jgi:hypothetical protein